MTTDLCRQLPA